MKKTWWKEGVVYQIYPRSFNDSNGDGIGDLPGIIEKLDYIKSLGVDIIWMCPIYKSPNDDNGYDISDYRNIMDEFGTMGDFELLLEQVHRRGMKLVLDLVPNHSSDEHRWFRKSAESKDNPYRDYYHWQPPMNGGPPNNWSSFFGGSAWEYDKATGEYYLHLFSRKQPDLNWENPDVRHEMYDIMRFWLNKGIDGFRLDVISLISKRTDYPDVKNDEFDDIVRKYYANGPHIHEYLHEMHEEVLDRYDMMAVGEGPGIDLEHGIDYVAASRKELDMIFHFDHMSIDEGAGGKYDPAEWSLAEFKRIFNDWDDLLYHNGGWGSIFLGNHDYPRVVSRFGNDGEYREQSAKQLATLLLSLRGTPYIFQGDEIGMTNAAFSSIDDYRDIETLRAWEQAELAGKNMDDFLRIVHAKSRDNARTPMQWDATPNGGFSVGEPWIRVNPNYRDINVSSQEEDPDSILNYYTEMIRFRKEHPTLIYGEYRCLQEKHPGIFAYERWDETRRFLVLLNFTDRTTAYDGELSDTAELKINNYNCSNEKKALRPREAKIFETG